jgi:hypothetical protein
MERSAISPPQALEGASFEKSHPRNELWNHVTAKRDLVIPKLSFVLDGTLRTDALDDEAIRFRCVLESLLPTP